MFCLKISQYERLTVIGEKKRKKKRIKTEATFSAGVTRSNAHLGVVDVLFIFLEGAGRVFSQYLADLFARSLSVSPSDRGLTSKISLIALRGVTFVLDDPDNQTTRPSFPLLGRQLRPHQK